MSPGNTEDRLASLVAASPADDASWLRAWYAGAPADLLAARSNPALHAAAVAAREHFRQRAPGTDGVALLRREDGAAVALLTCTDDKPFLVDTLLMLLREAGLGAERLLHPVLRVQRDASGLLLGLAADGGGLAESWMLAELDPPADAERAGALRESVLARLAELRLVVADYEPMRARLHALNADLRRVPRGADVAELAEAREFLRWLDAGHFTFLACTEARTVMGADGRAQRLPQPAAGLGLARPGARLADSETLIAPREELDRYAESPRVVVVTKAQQRASLHRDDDLDVIAVKQFDAAGRVCNTVRFIGLYSADAYEQRPWDIPLIRRKAELVLRRSQLDPDSYSGKQLREILGSFPRDELFQSGEDELFRTVSGIRELTPRTALRLFLRRDRYGRFFSALVYLPRERYSRELRETVATELRLACAGLAVERRVEFLRGGWARLLVQVRTVAGSVLGQGVEAIEQRLLRVTRPFREQLGEALVEAGINDAQGLAQRFGEAFASSYLERCGIEEAAADVAQLAPLCSAQPVRPSLLLALSGASRLKLYCWREPLALADVLPVLENLGLRVLRQDPEAVQPAGEEALWIQDFAVELAPGAQQASAREVELLLPQLLAGAAENDGLNRLVLAAGLSAREVLVLRVLAKYLNQVGLPYGRADIERIVATHPEAARLLVRQFEARFDPALDPVTRAQREQAGAQALDEALDQVASLEADRILRALVSVVRAGLRTNFWQRDAQGKPKAWVSLKLDPALVPELPQPRPAFEIWVYAREVEGVHLRGGRVARGGLRWSDRREDFRTEVLGLMKAQQVKNVVIVPVGAKGGFVVKHGPPASAREAWMAQGIACYQTFLRGLLDLTDNRVGDAIVPPLDVVRHDGDDPYLVVAADKGTATFSDIANGVAAEYGFWLGDAFASGGSAGYDHKKMGITARGAWESVQRHFRELGLDHRTQAFSVAGIGDMSGDVFGNGLLLSPRMRLLAAFDHRHIFIDPDPDTARSYAERQRLFALPRSSWADYDAALISPGGGVYARSAKRVEVSEAAARVLGIAPGALAPSELIRAILRAPVDLLWNGGIGTYVKAAHQSGEDVRDRANDAVRVNGGELRARVVGEGGNLGFTQAGRIEYALRGGRINTDAIDNSGGVHCSDREVNIKIPLNALMREGTLTRESRDALLGAMTDDIARFVLRDSYVQSGAISLMEAQAAARLDEHAALMRRLEREGRLDRALEGLPDDDTLAERRSAGLGLTRPELAVLMAYAKMSLFDAALASSMPDDPHFGAALLGNFPPALVARYRPALEGHRLRREIIATLLANALVNRMGASFAHRLAEDQGVSLAAVLRAYAGAHELLGADRYWDAIERLDHALPARTQTHLMLQAAALLKHLTGWIIGSGLGEQLGVGGLMARYGAVLPQIEALLPEVLPPLYREDYARHHASLLAEPLPEATATLLARAKALGSAPDLADLAAASALPLAAVARTYFALGERLRMPWLLSAIVQLRVAGPWQALARNKLRDDAYRLHRGLCAHVLASGGLEAWVAANEQRLKFSLGRLGELQASGASDYAALAVAVRELYSLQLG